MKNMTVVNCPEKLMSDTVRRKLGQPNGYGQEIYGVSDYGDENDLSGIYQMRPREAGAICVKMKFYTPTYRRTETQATIRDAFAAAVLAWQGLTEEDKNFYNAKAIGMEMFGYNLFISEALLA